jgi:hypothetical protein
MSGERKLTDCFRKDFSRLRLANLKLPYNLGNKHWLFIGRLAIAKVRELLWEIWDLLTLISEAE